MEVEFKTKISSSQMCKIDGFLTRQSIPFQDLFLAWMFLYSLDWNISWWEMVKHLCCLLLR